MTRTKQQRALADIEKSCLFPVFTDPDLYITAQALYEGGFDESAIPLLAHKSPWAPWPELSLMLPRKPLRGSHPDDPRIHLSQIYFMPDKDHRAAAIAALYGVLKSQANILRSVVHDPHDRFVFTGRGDSFGFRSPRFHDQVNPRAIITTLPEVEYLSLEEFQERALRAHLHPTRRRHR